MHIVKQQYMLMIGIYLKKKWRIFTLTIEFFFLTR